MNKQQNPLSFLCHYPLMDLVSIEIMLTIFIFLLFSDQPMIYVHVERFLAPLQRLRRLELITLYCVEGQFIDGKYLLLNIYHNY